MVALFLLGACADENGEPSQPPTATPPTAPPTTPPGSPPTVTPPPGETIQTVSGEVYAGVEAGCQLIHTGSADYLLIWRDGQFRSGETVTVRGYPDSDLATTCQQGTPFIVTEVVDD